MDWSCLDGVETVQLVNLTSSLSSSSSSSSLWFFFLLFGTNEATDISPHKNVGIKCKSNEMDRDIVIKANAAAATAAAITNQNTGY